MIDYIAAEKNIVRQKYDLIFILQVVLLLGLGLTTLYSASLGYATRFFDDPFYFVFKQGRSELVGVVALLFFSFVPLKFMQKHMQTIFMVTVVLLLLPFMPKIGLTRNGATRWIKIASLTFQPSEFAKLSMILILANFFAKQKDGKGIPSTAIFAAVVLSLTIIFLVYIENDFSTSVVLFLIAFLLFFIAGVPIRWFIYGIIIGLPFIVLMVMTRAYRLERILAFLHPGHDPLGIGYQTNAAVSAITSGGVWGQGLGNGIQKIASVPEIHSDFVFVAWAEEMGLIGVIAYFVLLLLFAVSGLKIALTTTNRFASYCAFGATAAIFVQSLLNTAVVSRLVPATGITLPFFSFGGSSLMITLCLCGLIINASGYMHIKEGDL